MYPAGFLTQRVHGPKVVFTRISIPILEQPKVSATQEIIPVRELLDQAPVAVTALDRQGNIVFFNQYATNIVDRKPEYLGRDIREFHQPASNDKVDAILRAYAQGGREEHSWRLKRGDKEFMVRVRPWLKHGKWAGLVHAVMLLG